MPSWRCNVVCVPIDELLEDDVPSPEAIVRVLEDAGIEFVFGMPGGRTGAIFNALHDHTPTIRTVLVREEGLANVMADMYGQLTGKPGVAMDQGAFLLTNGGMGIVEAFLALTQALQSDRPAVVDVVTSSRATFRDVTSPLAVRA